MIHPKLAFGKGDTSSRLSLYQGGCLCVPLDFRFIPRAAKAPKDGYDHLPRASSGVIAALRWFLVTLLTTPASRSVCSRAATALTRFNSDLLRRPPARDGELGPASGVSPRAANAQADRAKTEFPPIRLEEPHVVGLRLPGLCIVRHFEADPHAFLHL